MTDYSCSITAHHQPRWFDLHELARPDVVRHIEFYQSTGSTNDDAMRLAAENTTNLPLLVLAEEQTGGRGRGSNRWWAKNGSLTFSLVIQPSYYGIRPECWPLISLATAIGISDALGQCAAGHQIGLKWPNDLHLNRKKVCGILAETISTCSDRMVIGIGLNVRNSFADAPDELRSIATSIIDETGTDWDLTAVLNQLIVALDDRWHELGSGTLPLQETWSRHCVLTGKQVSLLAGEQRVAGLCRGINDRGALLLETDGKLQPWFGGVVRIEDLA